MTLFTETTLLSGPLNKTDLIYFFPQDTNQATVKFYIESSRKFK